MYKDTEQKTTNNMQQQRRYVCILELEWRAALQCLFCRL